MKKKIILTGSLLVAIFLFSFFGYLTILLFGDYTIDEQKLVFNQASSIVDQSGDTVSKLYVENREIISINEIPDHVQNAFVAVEDVRFYDHHGFDIRAIGRALYRDILAGSKAEGGSTITQQLVKNVYLTNEKSWLRKTKEVLIAINLERRYSKEEILSMYLNSIYFGHGTYGIQTAANYYFNKDVAELTVAEGALLASIPKAPYHYSPIIDLERSEQRRNLVLTLMERHDFITAEDAVRQQGKLIELDVQENEEQQAFYTYMDMVLEEANALYGLSNEEILTGGYTIVTPIDSQLQRDSLSIIQDSTNYPDGNDDAESAFVLMDSETGGVLAVHGGKEYVRLGLNRVRVKRQPGSAFKPLAVYAPALEKSDYNPYTVLNDVEQQFEGGYSPRNAGGVYRGEITMYEALTHSSNVSAVWLLNEIGITHSLDYLQKFGMKVDERQLGLALGGLDEGVTPLELAKAYRAFAADGKVTEPYFIEAIYDPYGQKIAEHKPKETQVISPQTAWNMTRMLESVVEKGTGTAGYSKHTLAGKTGTTSFDSVPGAVRDAWFVGYNQEVVGAIWMGYDRTTEDQYLTGGSSYPTQIFKEIINQVPTHYQQVAWRVPDEVDDLLPPVQLPEINDLVAVQSFGGEGLISVALSWSASSDKRIHYDVYEVNGEERKHLATVVGGDYFHQPKLNIFSTSYFEVVPYNSLTHQEGEASNLATSKFQFGFH
ncbi:penicillin-binding protein 1F [Alkalihalobacillus alcalophilus ATCC 27647 = CGMCC 1.3604]|uniref:Penicillin-binding protein n=1 Tax=Alkalihalobacillus alcalophilus ATCC 27647 = CGMCC 1.3604 TaxID=1218173 RepID=A0A094WPW5_ALKAL|nr:PBP1A family penicillin-binding protein [Alkalihalobacillus alcalophilus]KGA98078.1 penicillin-binding protein [Alkalihalobacillus alcalophilus ATCC 27647 = CGMCC 1.3604]MED1561034.1 PBP1A family penicillin-binding protein [Alkalihalobacillus alcalophilus]THG88343.1 penicillin-binding protein 1F [Alkalihalobacillus alcalophilus ATCC 27647 = CGMCC 1.3604]